MKKRKNARLERRKKKVLLKNFFFNRPFRVGKIHGDKNLNWGVNPFGGPQKIAPFFGGRGQKFTRKKKKKSKHLPPKILCLFPFQKPRPPRGGSPQKKFGKNGFFPNWKKKWEEKTLF